MLRGVERVRDRLQAGTRIAAEGEGGQESLGVPVQHPIQSWHKLGEQRIAVDYFSDIACQTQVGKRCSQSRASSGLLPDGKEEFVGPLHADRLDDFHDGVGIQELKSANILAREMERTSQTRIGVGPASGNDLDLFGSNLPAELGKPLKRTRANVSIVNDDLAGLQLAKVIGNLFRVVIHQEQRFPLKSHRLKQKCLPSPRGTTD